MKLVKRKFPKSRLRRTRMKLFSRKMVSENNLIANDVIWPLFLTEDSKTKVEIKTMPNVYRYPIEVLLKKLEVPVKQGLNAIALFPHISNSKKDDKGTHAFAHDNIICTSIKKIKQEYPHLGIICDVALDPYTSHGHDGLLDSDGQILNDETVKILCEQALVQANAGCDIISPSDMMDGRVGEIRRTLDKNNFDNVQIMSYSAKYASSFYGPFRDALGSTATLAEGSKATYQMDPRNSDEAMREIALDIAEGADMIMIKPGLPYLDIIYRTKQRFGVPTYGYQVSGEYSMIKAAVNNGWINHDSCITESLIAFKRAGANGILTYFALDAARLLKGCS